MRRACRKCLRRALLIASLAPRIAGLLDPSRGRVPGLLALSDERLVAAVAGRSDETRAVLDELDPETFGAELERAGIPVVCRHDDAYPEGLRALADPPAVIFSTASCDRLAGLLAEPAVAVVGTRRASAYGLEMAYALGRGLGAAGLTVVSGLALGVDGAAHRGCLDAAGKAIAVLAGGVDIPYPSRNRRLYARVRETGAVVSEMPPGQRAYRWSFPARNRIMAALAEMTVVVEAADPSGSLITAQFAGDLGRTVGAVPGRATARTAAGTNALLRDGARVVTRADDVLEELFGVAAARRLEHAQSDPREGLDRALRAVLDAVEAGHGLDDASRAAGLSSGETRAALARLEADGWIVRTGLGSYERAAPA